MLPGHSVVTALGHQVSVLDAGRGRPILLLHGFTLSGRSFRHQWAPLVSAGFRPIAPDSPGFGRTRLGAGFAARAEDYADLQVALLEALGVEPPVPVVGHSLGGGMGLFLAARRPGTVSCLVAVAPASEPSHAAMRIARVARRERFEEIAPIFFTRDRLRRIVLSGYGANPPPPDVVDEYVDGISVSDAFGIAATYFSPEFLDLPSLYGRIDVPVLIVVGEDDPHDHVALSERPAREIPGSELVVMPGTAHCPHEEAPEGFNGIVLDFLARRLGQ